MANLDEENNNWLEFLLKYANIQVWITLVAGGLWIILDLVSYGTRVYSGVSYSYGYFLVAWGIIQFPTLTFSIGTIFGFYYSLEFACLYLVLIKIIVSFCQKRQKSNQTAFTKFDQLITERVFNILILALITNIILHFYIEN